MDNKDIDRAIERYCMQHGMEFWQPKGALIDMDGTLIDSMKNHSRAWKQMTDEQGLDVDADEFYLFEGMTGRATIRLLWERELGQHPSDEQCDELYARKARLFNEMPKVPAIAGAADMLRTLMDGGVTRVLVTGSKQLSSLDRLDDDFPGAFPADMRITAADVEHGKPSPEPYLKGMALGGLRPGESLVIENAPLGVKSGHDSGAFTIAVTTGPIPAEKLAEAGADLVFGSMEELAASMGFILSRRVF